VQGSEGPAIWNSVAFYNYIRHLLPEPSTQPTPEMLSEPGAALAFREVLANLKPGCVLVFSARVFGCMPPYNCSDPVAKEQIGRPAGWYETADGQYALAVGLTHPSAWSRRQQDARYWHRFVIRSIACARRETPLAAKPSVA